MILNTYWIRGIELSEGGADASEFLSAWHFGQLGRSHDVGSSSWNNDGMVVGDIRQCSAAAVALGAAFHRVPTEFPDTVAQKNVLHTDRIYITKSSSSIS